MRRSVLVLRPEPDASATADAVAGLGWRPIVSPLLDIRPVASELVESDALIVSSPRAVIHALPAALARPAFVVGERTATDWRARGGRVEAVRPDGERLSALLRDSSLSLLHMSGEEIAFDFQAALPGRVSRAIVYHAVPHALSEEAKVALESGQTTALLTSPRIARLLAAEGGRVRAVAMSPAVAEAWGAGAEIAAEPTLDALLARLGQP